MRMTLGPPNVVLQRRVGWRRGMSVVRTDGLSRYSIVVAVVMLALGLSEGASGQTAVASRHRAAAAVPESPLHCRGATWIQGVTENRTDTGIRVAQDGLGFTNRWCISPADDVRAHASDQWRASDALGDTDLHIVYLLDNGDQVLFRARVVKDGPVDVGCSFVEQARPPRELCQAEVVGGAAHNFGFNFAFVRFSLLPVRR
jgi:hypothetical protein